MVIFIFKVEPILAKDLTALQKMLLTSILVKREPNNKFVIAFFQG